MRVEYFQDDVQEVFGVVSHLIAGWSDVLKIFRKCCTNYLTTQFY